MSDRLVGVVCLGYWPKYFAILKQIYASVQLAFYTYIRSWYVRKPYIYIYIYIRGWEISRYLFEYHDISSKIHGERRFLTRYYACPLVASVVMKHKQCPYSPLPRSPKYTWPLMWMSSTVNWTQETTAYIVHIYLHFSHRPINVGI